MEIHKPKPIHSWKELVSEIGVIVIGILIALGLEQAIEGYHQREKVEAMRQALKDEMKVDLSVAMEFAETADCANIQLAAIRSALETGDRERAKALSATTLLPSRFWPDDAMAALTSSQVSDSLGRQELLRYAGFYRAVRLERQMGQQLDELLSDLRNASIKGEGASPDMTRELLGKTARMQGLIDEMVGYAGFLRDWAKTNFHLVLTEKEYASRLQRADAVAQCKAGAAALRGS